MRSRLLSPILAVVVLLLSACMTTIRQDPDFHTRIAKVKTVGVMPAEAEIVRVVFNGDNERLRGEEEAVEELLTASLLRELARHDFTVRQVDLNERVLADFPDLRFETSLVQRSYASTLAELYQTPQVLVGDSLVEKSLGSNVNQFADVTDTDALLFAKLSGFHKSGGEFAKDLVIGVVFGNLQPSDGASLQVSLVDGATGDLLWSNMVSVGGNFEGQALGELVTRAFSEFER